MSPFGQSHFKPLLKEPLKGVGQSPFAVHALGWGGKVKYRPLVNTNGFY